MAFSIRLTRREVKPMWKNEELEVVRDVALGSWSRTLQLALLLLAAGLASALVAARTKLSRL